MNLLRGAKMMKPQETPQAGTREREQSSEVTPRSHDKPVASSTSYRLMEVMSKWTDLKHNGTFFSREGQRAAITMSTGLENMLKIPGSDVNVRGYRV